MKNWKNWLFPILTCLTVAALALLPQRLSTLRDGELMGTVHAEALSEDSNFPFKPPDLPGRIWLLVQWQELPEQLTIMAQELEGAERDREMQRLQDALDGLSGILPPDAAAQLSEIDGDSWNWERLYLRDQTDLSSASFTMASTYEKQRNLFLSATLDGESGQILNLQVIGIPFNVSPLEMGKSVLDRLGLDYVPVLDYDAVAYFRLPGCKSQFLLGIDSLTLSFNFLLDWEAVDRETAESHGYPGSFAMDADSMQKW